MTRPVKRQPRRVSRMATWISAFALGIGLAAEAVRWSVIPEARAEVAPVVHGADGSVGLERVSSSFLEMPAGVQTAHASTLAVLPGDRMQAFWWAGSRESGPDVKVFASHWSEGEWSEPKALVSRDSLAKELGFAVRRIGNPSAWVARDGKTNLFVVATGLGGWAASRVVHLVSEDRGDSFQVRRVLPLSPLFNTSVLVRTTPIGLADGGWWLPLHFELGHKYPMVMSFDNVGQPRWLVRIGESTTALQPAMVAVSDREIRAWMRDIGQQRRVQQAVSRNGGASWEDLPAMDIPNHDSSVAALRLKDGGYVLLHNDRVTADASPRSVLRLSVSRDAKAWSHGVDVAIGGPDDELSYPSVQQVGDELHVTHTAQRRTIAHHVYRIAYRP